MINFQYDAEHWKLYKAAQFNVVEKTPLREVSAPNFTFEYYTGKPITFEIRLPEVSNLKATGKTTDSIELKWSKDNVVDGYELQRYDNATKKYKTIATLKNTTTSYTNKNLKSAYTYKYRVRGYKTINGKKYYSDYSSSVSRVTLPKTPSIKLTTSNRSAKISWTRISEATGYEVYRATSSKGTYSKVKTITSRNTVSYTNTGLKKGKTYYYKVKAYKTVNGKKVYSSYSSVKYIKVK